MKQLTILGESPFGNEVDDAKRPRIGTLFPRDAVLVTTAPQIHALQRLHYTRHLQQERAAAGLPPLSEAEELEIQMQAVDLMFPPGSIQIRPEPSEMALAFAADELLQTRVPKHRIHFLRADHGLVRQAIKARGESWRICPRPCSEQDIVALLAQSRVQIGGPAEYYYSPEHGTRYLTCREFARLGRLDDATLAGQLTEIQQYSATRNRLGRADLSFFPDGRALHARDFAGVDFAAMSTVALRLWHAETARRFTAAVPPELRDDQPRNPAWRSGMFLQLIAGHSDTTSVDILQDLNPEFLLQIQWLPGGRIEDGELIFDSVFDDAARHPHDAELRQGCDLRVKRFIGNFIREFGMLEYVNVGSIAASVRQHGVQGEAHRAYIAEIKHPGAVRPVVRILRLAKWGVREHLEQDHWDLLRSYMETEMYLDYILDRRLGCWQLGMRLPNHTRQLRFPETYDGVCAEYRGQTTWVHYFERDYIEGIATNKIPATAFEYPEFALAFARLLGEAAAVNLIVGRMTVDRARVIFDDGDEILVRDEKGAPAQIVVADHAGTFVDSGTDLEEFARAYADPVNRRNDKIPDLCAFAQAYLQAFDDRFRNVQSDYRKHRRAFDTLFQHQSQEPGSIAWRWGRVLARLDRTDPASLVRAIAGHMACWAEPRDDGKAA